MSAKSKETEEIKISTKEFDRMMRGALESPAPAKPQKKAREKKKPAAKK